MTPKKITIISLYFEFDTQNDTQNEPQKFIVTIILTKESSISIILHHQQPSFVYKYYKNIGNLMIFILNSLEKNVKYLKTRS